MWLVMRFKHVALLGFSCVSLSVTASGSDGWELLSDLGAYGLVGAALATPAYKEDWQGFRQAAYSVATASAVGLVGKVTIDAERPDKSGNDSFPSNHTANAFASATTLNIRYGWRAGLPAYGVATLVGIGRVQADKHYWKDVAAGAAIGSLSGWLLTDKLDENVQLTPWATTKGAGFSVTYVW